VVRIAGAAGVLCLIGLPVHAQSRARPFEIMDNSFLVEEAFNQEAGIFQNIFLIQRARTGGGWGVEFTQEWPLGGQRHQLSYTVPFDFDASELGDIAINYRLQLRVDDAAGPAVSPRLSAILPTGTDENFEWGLQFNLPVSKQWGDVHLHANAGATWRSQSVERLLADDATVRLLSPQVAASLIWRALPMVHLMVESVASWQEELVGGLCCDTAHDGSWLVAPGLRVGKNIGSHQLVLGGAVPFAPSGSRPDSDLVLYFSYELPFRAVR
jgi:hypothetical protein